MSWRVKQPFRHLTDMGAVAHDTTHTPPPARHVLARDSQGTWTPALLLGWQRRDTAWWGRVAMVEHGEAALIDLIAARLKPANCDCCTGPRAR